MSNKFNTISMDTGAVIQEIKNHFLKAMEDVEKELIRVFQREIMTNGSGRTAWRKEASDAVKEVSREIVDDYMELEVGVDPDQKSYSEDLFVRVMVAIDGNQAGGAQTSKPGKQVYGKNIDGKHKSKAKTVYYLPAGFNQSGISEQTISNAVKQIEKIYGDALEAAAVSLDESVFYGNVIVSAS